MRTSAGQVGFHRVQIRPMVRNEALALIPHNTNSRRIASTAPYSPKSLFVFRARRIVNTRCSTLRFVRREEYGLEGRST